MLTRRRKVTYTSTKPPKRAPDSTDTSDEDTGNKPTVVTVTSQRGISNHQGTVIVLFLLILGLRLVESNRLATVWGVLFSGVKIPTLPPGTTLGPEIGAPGSLPEPIPIRKGASGA